MRTSNLNTPSVFLAAAATGTAAVILFSLMPVLIGALADQFDLSDTQSGLIATAYFSSYALVTLTSPAWIRRSNWRRVTVFAYVALVVGILFFWLAGSYTQILVSMVAAGCGAGILFPLSLTIAADTERPERTYALQIMPEQLIPAGLLLLVAGLNIVGTGSLILMVLATVLLCVLASWGMPAQGLAVTAGNARQGNVALGLLALLALAINFSGYAGLWVFFERIAAQQNFPDTFTQTWLAVGLVMSGVGPIFAAIYANRFGYVMPIILGTVISILAMAALVAEVSQLRYALVLVVLPLAYYVAITYIMAVIADVDDTGKMAGLMSFALAVGAAGGPALFGALNDAGHSAVPVMIVAVALGAVLSAIVMKLSAHKKTGFV